MKVIGLGKAGCNIANAFSKFPQYECWGIDTEKEADITIRRRLTHEDYDAHFPNLKKKLKVVNSDVLMVVCGAGAISGGILRLVEQLKENRVDILYVQPDLSLLSEVQQMRERVVRNILQEYARSGALNSIFLVDNQLIEEGIGEIPIKGYYGVLNQAIVNLIHMLNIFKNSEPIIGNFMQPSNLSRIATYGIVDVETETEKWFYPLTEVRDVVYYYGINEKELEEDGALYGKIKNFVKSHHTPGVNVSYGVFETAYDQKYCYCIKYSSMVQSYKELLDD
jgi:hypothetical protein